MNGQAPKMRREILAKLTKGFWTPRAVYNGKGTAPNEGRFSFFLDAIKQRSSGHPPGDLAVDFLPWEGVV